MNLYAKMKLERNEINKGVGFMKKLIALFLAIMICCVALASCSSEDELRSQVECELRTSIENELTPVIKNELRSEVEQELLDEQREEQLEKLQNGYKFYQIDCDSVGAFRCLGIYDKYESFLSDHANMSSLAPMIKEETFEENYVMVMAFGKGSNYINQAYYDFKIEYSKAGTPIGYSIEYYASLDYAGLNTRVVEMHIVLIPKKDIKLPEGIDSGKTIIHETIEVLEGEVK